MVTVGVGFTTVGVGVLGSEVDVGDDEGVAKIASTFGPNWPGDGWLLASVCVAVLVAEGAWGVSVGVAVLSSGVSVGSEKKVSAAKAEAEFCWSPPGVAVPPTVVLTYWPEPTGGWTTVLKLRVE